MGAEHEPVTGTVVEEAHLTDFDQMVEGKVVDGHDNTPITPAPEGPVLVDTVEVVDPAVGHFWPACVSTFFCHLLGLGLTLVCCPSSYGKAGAATGFAFSALKMSIVALMGAMVVSHYHVPHAFYPDELKTADACAAYRGVWEATPDPKTHLMSPMTCHCPRLFLAPREEGTGRVVCVDSQRFWVKVSIIASVMFYLFSIIARYYLRNSKPTTMVTVVAANAAPVIVVREEKMEC